MIKVAVYVARLEVSQLRCQVALAFPQAWDKTQWGWFADVAGVGERDGRGACTSLRLSRENSAETKTRVVAWIPAVPELDCTGTNHPLKQEPPAAEPGSRKVPVSL